MASKAQLVQKEILALKEKRVTKATKALKVNPDLLESKAFKEYRVSKAKLVQWVLEVLPVQLVQEV